MTTVAPSIDSKEKWGQNCLSFLFSLLLWQMLHSSDKRKRTTSPLQHSAIFSTLFTLEFNSMAKSVLVTLLTLAAVQVLYLLRQANSATHQHDVHVLKHIKSAITQNSVPQASCIDSWDFSVDPCAALFTEKFTCGIRCDVVVGSEARVTELALDSAGYSGDLSAVKWTLPFLQNLELSNNFFYGRIPDSFSALSRLRRLGISHNSFSGAVPAALGSLWNLEEMYLDNNMLTGEIPASLNGLKNLKRLEIRGNKLSGELPDLSQLGNLNFLDVSDNSVTGELPVSLPPSLVELAMRNNRIEGNIPASLSTLYFLQVVDLSHNLLSGSVPAGLFAHPGLEQLTLSYNQLESVQIPGTLGLTSQLISVDLSNNQLRGFLPGFMGSMPRLSALSLENNKFSGLIPAQYVLKVLIPGSGSGMSPFVRLLLGGNYLFGPIPVGLFDVKSGSVDIRLGDNCLFRCPVRFFFCVGGAQKPLIQCRAFGPVVP